VLLLRLLPIGFSVVVLTGFSREATKANKRDRVQWTKNSNRSIMVRNLFHLNFAASREKVFCANPQRVQEKYN
jgi:hypothetical protein